MAGALLFVQPAVLAARYDLGIEVPLPALTLVGFLAAVTLAVLLYFVAISAPVTIPPGSQRDPKAPRRSHIFFELIALETDDSWRKLWDSPEPALRDALTDGYRAEIMNLAQRARSKRRRSTEASSLVVTALLFFGLTVGLSIDVLRYAEPWVEPGFTRLETPLPWGLPLRVAVAAGLAWFALVVLYQRLRASRVRRPDEAQGGMLAVMGA